MAFIYRITGSLAASATFLLVILDILQKHLGIDTEALLLSVGGDIGNVIAGVAAIFSGGITSIADWLAGLMNNAPPAAAPPCEINCDEGVMPKSGLSREAITQGAGSFELAVQILVGAVALFAAFLFLRQRA